MSTTRGEPEPETPRAEKVQAVVRSVVGGHTEAAVRRILLYGIVIAMLALDGTLGVIGGGIGLIAVLLLVATDPL